MAVGDASALPLSDRSVDAAVLVSMLHHVPDWEAALAVPVLYVDGSVTALCRRPELLCRPDVRAQTSYFEWAGGSAPDELASGAARLAADLAAGARPQDEASDRRAALGDASVISWRRPV